MASNLPSGRIRLKWLGSGREPVELDAPAPGAVVVLGRPSASGPAPDVPLNDPSVSRRHAELSVRDGAWCMQGLGKAGTIIDGALAAAGVWVQLRHGAVIQVGPYGFQVDLGRAATSHAFETIGFADDADSVRAVRVPAAELERMAELRLSQLAAASDAIGGADSAESVLAAAARVLVESRDFERAAVVAAVEDGGEVRYETVAVAPDAAALQGGSLSRTLLGAARAAGQMVQMEDDLRFRAAESMIGTNAAVCAPVTSRQGVTKYLLYADCRSGGRPGSAAIPFANLVSRLAGSALVAVEQRRMMGDLEQARVVQQRLMPKEEGRCGHVSWSLFSRAADTCVSGDFFSIIEAPDGRVVAVIGDVAGKGVGAGLVMAAAVTHLDGTVRVGLPIERSMTGVSDYFARRQSFEVATAGFITALGVEVHPDGRCRAVDAGHSYAALVRADGTAEPMAFPNGAFSTGWVEGTEYSADEFRLGAGDRVVLFSDGIAEQTGRDGARLAASYAEDPSAVLAALRGSRGPEDDVRRLRELLVRHAAGRPWEDDVTVASIAYVPS